MQQLSVIHAFSTFFLVCLLLLGALARFTRGSAPLTGAFHDYQCDRQSDENLMSLIAACDLGLAVLLIPRFTRPLAAALISAAMAGGAYFRMQHQHRDATVDVALTAVAFTVLSTCFHKSR